MKKPPAQAASLAGALGHAPADKRIDILRLIHASGSISQAAREAGVSYKAAWQAIDTLTNLAGVELLQRAVGGAGGGGAVVTPAGVELLEAARHLEEAREQALARWQSGRIPSGGEGGNALAGANARALHQLTVRTSMRNQLPCEVRGLQRQGRVVRVEMALPGGASIFSRITLESAELLALRPGLAVLALCKATAVSVAAATGPQPRRAPPHINLLPGRASRVSREGGDHEVAITLDSGLQMVGLAPADAGLRVRQRVMARVNDSAVAIATAN